jgi:TonB family protein
VSRRDFGRYKIAEEVGRGAMGVVYRALDPVMGRTVAIKAINLSYLEAIGVKASEYFERFRREAEVAGRLNHPHIVKIYDLGPDYLVMEYVDGQSLASMLSARVRPRPTRILRILADVADAFDHAHRQGIVHRDIKPGNVMIQPDGSPKVMDFGLARIESSTLTAAGEILGSASYMAPEVVLGRPADARSDLFSFGVMAYELITGQRPFSGPSITVIIQNVVRANPRPAREVNLHLPPEFDAIFERVLAKEPSVRYHSATEFAAALALRPWDEPGLPEGGDELLADLPPLENLPPPESPPPVPSLPDLDPDATIPPGAYPVVLRDAALQPPDADETGATTLVAPVLDRPLFAEDDEAGARTVRVVRPGPAEPAAALATLPAGLAGMVEPGPPAASDDDSPLRSLVETLPPAVVAPPPAPVAPPPPPAPAVVAKAPEPRSVRPQPPRRQMSMLAIGVLAASVLVILAATLSVFVYRWLVRRTATGAPPVSLAAAPLTTLAAAPATTLQVIPSPAPPASAEAPAATPAPTPEAPAATPAPRAPVLTTLSLSSDPPGARVSVGRKREGMTPLRLQVPPGRVSLTLEKEGFKPWKRDATVGNRGLTLEARLEPLHVATPPPAPPPTPAGVKTGDLVPLGPDVTAPRKLSGIGPRLPPKVKLAGSVLVEFVVDENGQVADPKVVESAGEGLDAACVEAVRHWTYEPAVSQGVKVKVLLRAKFTFQSR